MSRKDEKDALSHYTTIGLAVALICVIAFVAMSTQEPSYYSSSPNLPEPQETSNYMNTTNHQGISATSGDYSTPTPPDNVEPDDQEEGYDEDNEDLAPP